MMMPKHHTPCIAYMADGSSEVPVVLSVRWMTRIRGGWSHKLSNAFLSQNRGPWGEPNDGIRFRLRRFLSGENTKPCWNTTLPWEFSNRKVIWCQSNQRKQSEQSDSVNSGATKRRSFGNWFWAMAVAIRRFRQRYRPRRFVGLKSNPTNSFKHK